MKNINTKMPKVWIEKIGDWFHILVSCNNGSNITRAKNKEIDKMGKVIQILKDEKEEKVKNILFDVMQKLEKAYEMTDLDDRILKIMQKVEDLM